MKTTPTTTRKGNGIGVSNAMLDRKPKRAAPLLAKSMAGDTADAAEEPSLNALIRFYGFGDFGPFFYF